MREVGTALSRSTVFAFAGAMDYPLADPLALYSKTPARIRASAGVRFAKLTFAPGIEAGLNLGLGASLPMPRGRQLARARWSHVDQHPPGWFPGPPPRRADWSGALTTFCIWAFDRAPSRAVAWGRRMKSVERWKAAVGGIVLLMFAICAGGRAHAESQFFSLYDFQLED